jgi:hypothetical protein
MSNDLLRELAEAVKLNFDCECEPGIDEHGDEVDCDGACDGKGTGPDGCWWCQADAALRAAKGTS